MKLTDYIARFLAGQGVTKAFGLTGGAVVHILDSLCRQPEIETVFMHHEQAVAFAAQASARVRNDVSVAVVTTGPGGTNALTGLTAAWLDSVPCVFLSGQVRLSHARAAEGLRQVGSQHLDIVNLVKPITKYAVMLTDPKQIRQELEKALQIARSGRPGPVWIDIPLDLQWAQVDPDTLPAFAPAPSESTEPRLNEKDLAACRDLLKASQRPVVIFGYGVKLSGAEDLARAFVEQSEIPFLTTWNASDMFDSAQPSNLGRPGIFGQRGANLAMQNADLVLAIGSHLCISLTGTQTHLFAPAAKVVMVNVDKAQIDKATVRVDLGIHASAKDFLKALTSAPVKTPGSEDWQQLCSVYHDTYSWAPTEKPAPASPTTPYSLMELLSEKLEKDAVVVVDGGGTVNQVAFQSLRVKRGQRLLISSGVCSMGSGLPESVGACLQSGRKRTVCLNGDGSLQLNIQELQTLVHHQLPVSIFVLCNDGYTSIRQTQEGFLENRRFGSESSGGMSLPDYEAVGKAYGLKVFKVDHHSELERNVSAALSEAGPSLCLVKVDPEFKPEPRQGFAPNPDGTFAARPLHDMFPFLPREEYAQLMRHPF